MVMRGMWSGRGGTGVAAVGGRGDEKKVAILDYALWSLPCSFYGSHAEALALLFRVGMKVYVSPTMQLLAFSAWSLCLETFLIRYLHLIKLLTPLEH